MGNFGHMWERKCKVQKKMTAKYASTKDVMRKNFFYEGSLKIKNMSDREEARQLLSWTIQQLEDISNRSDGQNDDLQEAQSFLAEFE